MTRILALLVALLSLGSPAAAQVVLDDVQNLDFDRPESWAMKYFTALSSATGMGVPAPLAAGELHLALEAGSVPSLSADERRVGFNGSKVEDLNRTSVFGRPRLLVGVGAGVTLEVGYLPPVEIDGVEPDLLSLAVARQLHESERWRTGARIVAQRGTLEGDITCTAREAAAGPDPAANPLLCLEPSSDELTTRSYGLELAAALKLPGSAFEPYLAAGLTRMDLEFQIDARWSVFEDRTLQKTDGTTWHAALGTRFDGWRRASLAAELYYSPLDVVRPPSTRVETDALLNVRVLYRYRLR